MTKSTEIQLLDELRSGNRIAFERIYKTYYSLMTYEARGYIRTEHLVEEIVNDVFTRLWFNREKLLIKTSLREYLVKSVHNSCTDYYRSNRAQERLKTDFQNKTTEAYTLIDLGENPIDYILTEELETRINKAIELLPDRYRQAFKLSRFEDLSYDEIAQKMGISVNSVKTNIKNALANLREQLADLLVLILIFFSSGLSN